MVIHRSTRLESWEVSTNYVDWCGQSHLHINASKTKEMVTGFCRSTDFHISKHPRPFGVCRTLVKKFYDAMVAYAIIHAVVCWICRSSDWDRKRRFLYNSLFCFLCNFQFRSLSPPTPSDIWQFLYLLV